MSSSPLQDSLAVPTGTRRGEVVWRSLLGVAAFVASAGCAWFAAITAAEVAVLGATSILWTLLFPRFVGGLPLRFLILPMAVAVGSAELLAGSPDRPAVDAIALVVGNIAVLVLVQHVRSRSSTAAVSSWTWAFARSTPSVARGPRHGRFE